MDTYAASSAAASKLTPFTPAPQTTNAGGLAGQAAAVAQATSTSAGTSAQTVTSTASPLLQWLANLSTDYTDTLNGLLNSLFGPTGASTYTALYSAVKVPLGFTTGFNDAGLITNFPVSQFLKFTPAPGFGAIPKEGLGGGLTGPWWGRGWLTSSVSADMGNAGTLAGKLSVPPSWATATPAIRTVAAALSASGPEAVPAAAIAEAGMFSSMPAAGMLGSAIGAGAPTVVANSGVRGRLDSAQGPQRQAVAGATEAAGRTNIGEAGKRAAPHGRPRRSRKSARTTGEETRRPRGASVQRRQGESRAVGCSVGLGDNLIPDTQRKKDE